MLWVKISIRARCTTLCDQVCQWLATGRWFSPCPPVSSTNKTDRHDSWILLKQNKYIICHVLPLEIELLASRGKGGGGGGGIPIIGLTLPHFFVCPKPVPGFPASYDMVFLMFNDMMWEVIVWLNCWPSLFKLSFLNTIKFFTFCQNLSFYQNWFLVMFILKWIVAMKLIFK